MFVILLLPLLLLLLLLLPVLLLGERPPPLKGEELKKYIASRINRDAVKRVRVFYPIASSLSAASSSASSSASSLSSAGALSNRDMDARGLHRIGELARIRRGGRRDGGSSSKVVDELVMEY